MNGLPPKGLLVRSTTFDDRKARRQDVANTVFGFQPSMKRSQTFMGDRKVTPEPVQFSDVLFRRFFGAESSNFVPLHKGMRMPSMSFGPSAKKQDEAVIVVDTFSTGAMLCDLLYSKGFKVIRVLSGDLQDLLDMVPDGLNFTFEASFMLSTDVEQEVAIEDIIRGVRALGFPVIAVLAGAETGVELADQLSERMGLITNGTALSEARRNKFVMGETIRSAGIRAVKQLRATTWGEIDLWIKEWNPVPFKVIVKPMDSAGSDDVTLCHSYHDVQNAFGNIMGKVNGLGLVNKAVLVQEYLEGQEYVVDMVSREGEHKVAAIWAYDRRPANGAHFVCFGQRLLTADDPLCPELVAYMKKVVTALGIRYVRLLQAVYQFVPVYLYACVCTHARHYHHDDSTVFSECDLNDLH
jgi:ATP-grasp domain